MKAERRFKYKSFTARQAFLTLAVLCALLAAIVVTPFGSRPAYAACTNCSCVVALHNQTRQFIVNQHDLTRLHITQEFKQHQRWWMVDFFNQYILPAEMMMAEQLSAVGMQQMEVVGALLDAKHQLESQQLFQRLTAEAHKDYQSSHGMCTIATAARSLYNTDRRGELTAHVLARRSLARQLGSADTMASDGPSSDYESRISQFRTRYCDIHDDNSWLDKFCDSSAPAETINKDIDYTRLIDEPMTLDADFTDGTTAQGDEADIMSLAANLFSQNIFDRLGKEPGAILSNNQAYFDLRTVVAKRSVAENSFYSIVGMKAKGSEEAEKTASYVGVILQQLGVPDDEIFKMLGERPSYYALMNILAQKIYQRPEFYTDLYDTPANVARKDTAMRGIGLMLDRDMYKSDLRYESMLAVLVELELMKQQRRVQNRIPGTEENYLPESLPMMTTPGGATP